ncbi:MAG TPA: hypothetical protein VNG71_08195, partial [Pyrinomonadaceae bacterium]|nr:hypothetical protein [Pyrinomonadaceae bacterium]
PSDALDEVARGLGRLIDQTQPPPAPMHSMPLNVDDVGAGVASAETRESNGTLTLGETLAIWRLKPAAFQALRTGHLSGDLINWVESTKFLYHQIRLNGEPQGFARSYVDDKRKPPRLGIDASDFAAKLGRVLRDIDEPTTIQNHERDDPFFQKDPIVRLLEIPACRIFALWLLVEPDESRAIIVTATAPRSEFESGRILNSEEFYQALYFYRPLLGVG